MSINSQEEVNVVGKPPVVNIPSLWINQYLKENIAKFIKINVPLVPTIPTNIEDFNDTWTNIDGVRYPYAGVIGVYDRMIRMRRKTFPHIKHEQLVFSFYATQDNAIDKVFGITETVLRLFDGEDESGYDLNAWTEGKEINVNGADLTNDFYFHRFKVYQLEETADNVSFGSVRTYGYSKLIVEYEYHRVS